MKLLDQICEEWRASAHRLVSARTAYHDALREFETLCEKRAEAVREFERRKVEEENV